MGTFLHVRVGARQPPCLGHRLQERRMDTRLLVHQLRQDVEVGLDQRAQLAPALDAGHDRAPRRGSPAAHARRWSSRSCRAACATARASRTGSDQAARGDAIRNSSSARANISPGGAPRSPRVARRDDGEAIAGQTHPRALHVAQHRHERGALSPPSAARAPAQQSAARCHAASASSSTASLASGSSPAACEPTLFT